ncbi:A24 family peptidase [Spongiibacter taiwanensis]|uniref:prepilin peptidase n=1 Tax=Spongiibacter taiwanensis TaxID=1748242 RepID=UPI002036312C|nr:A24 family peptidase [Spongiibacter taiwanensis]USA43588.1 A24 family peptidase [Spongiibacter taiwanensis]
MLLVSVLLLIGAIDWQQRRIPNLLLAVLLGIVVLHRNTMPGPTGIVLFSNVVFALVVTAPAYAKKILGAGDVKLMLVLSPVWPTVIFLQVFALGILSLVAVMLLQKIVTQASLVKKLTPSQSPPCGHSFDLRFSRGLPLGTAIALGALITQVLAVFG